MIFYKEITICNLFAYYGEQTIKFDQEKGKNLYLIYGNNGYGKTSFLRSIKLLFLGSGLLEYKANISPSLAKISGDRRATPRTFLKPSSYDTDWSGALNKKAIQNDENKFYIKLTLLKSDKEFTIKRSWKHRNEDIEEKLELYAGDDIYTNLEAQEKINNILPPSFIDFFVFDGEEIESMADELNTGLKEKTKNILDITGLEMLVKGFKTLKNELFMENSNSIEEKQNLKNLEKQIDMNKGNIDHNLKIITEHNEFLKDIQCELSSLQEKRDKLIKNSGKQESSLKNKQEELTRYIQHNKDEFKENAGDILFLGIDDFLEELKTAIEKTLNSHSANGLLRLNREEISARITDELVKGGHNLDQYRIRDCILKVLNEMVKEGGENKFFTSLNIDEGKNSIISAQANNKNLAKNIIQIQQSFKDLKTVETELYECLNENIFKDEIESVKSEMEEKQKQINDLLNKINELKKQNSELDQDAQEKEREITGLQSKIAQDSRIATQIKLNDELSKIVSEYVKGRVEKLLIGLKDKVLENYKLLIPNDNVDKIEIDSEFSLVFKDKNGFKIHTASQSAGQKQATAISIFWALSSLSDKKLPLIIDTPLSRMDKKNTKNIIQNYYFNASNQIIILPHSSKEFGSDEIAISQDKIAGIFEIANEEDRQSATFLTKNINEKLGE